MTKHSDLSGADLHEPKGAATATSGQVYVADGAGSGTWTDLTSDNQTSVTSIDDFPSPVSGVITLADDTVYVVSGDISLGSRRLVMGSNTVLRGDSNLADSLTSTTTGVFLTITDVNCEIKDLSISAANASALWDIDGTGAERVMFKDLVIPVADVLGDIDNLDELIFDKITVESLTTNGMTFTGAFDDAHIHEFECESFAGTLIDLQTATFNSIVITDNVIVLGAGDTYLTVAASGANINSGKEGFLYGNHIDNSAGGTVVSGLDTGDVKWISSLNYGVTNSLRAAQGYIENNATATTFSGTGAGNEVVVNFSTSFVADVQKGFTVSNAGRFTYNGLNSRNFYVNANIYASITGGAARTYNWYIAKNGAIIASSVSQRDYDGTNSGSCSCSSHVSVVNGDYIELYIRAETATTSLTADTVSISVSEA